jgi:hypothetical protein
MSGKIRSFSVSAFEPAIRPYRVTARLRHQLMHRLAEAFGVAPEMLKDPVDALWKNSPVFMVDVGMAILPGDFPSVSYQMFASSAPLN